MSRTTFDGGAPVQVVRNVQAVSIVHSSYLHSTIGTFGTGRSIWSLYDDLNAAKRLSGLNVLNCLQSELARACFHVDLSPINPVDGIYG
jgi:hypothetical protein